MTYQQKLDVLMKECDQKATAFIEALDVNEQYSVHISTVKSEWEAAERAYMNCHNFVQAGRVGLHDIAIY